MLTGHLVGPTQEVSVMGGVSLAVIPPPERGELAVQIRFRTMEH